MYHKVTQEGCLSDLRLDAYLADERVSQEQGEVLRHLGHCTRGKARFEKLDEARVAYHQDARSLSLEAWLQARAGDKQRSGCTVGGLSGFALPALAFFAILPRSAPAPEGGTRGKGSSRIGFHVKHGEDVRTGKDGESVQPGDGLRFTYSVARTSRLTIMSFDPAQRASVKFSAWVGLTQNKALANAVELDGSPGVGRIYGLFCARETAAEVLRLKLERGAGAPPQKPGCELAQLRIAKVSSR